MARGDIRVGISGWRYPRWRGVFYPRRLRQADELGFAAHTFRTIEINGTFYSLQRPSSFAAWAATVPDDFVFAVKGPRFITHMLQLKNAETALANFFASGIFALERTLGPILWQFSSKFRFNPERLTAFFDLLPKNTQEAMKLARRRSAIVKGRELLRCRTDAAIRYAVEVRHESFYTPDFISLLRRYGIALVCTDAPGWSRHMDVSADFVYCRLHGAEELYASGYEEPALRQWCDRACAWAEGRELATTDRLAGAAPKRSDGRDVFVYFDNDAKVRAPLDAKKLIALVQRQCG